MRRLRCLRTFGVTEKGVVPPIGLHQAGLPVQLPPHTHRHKLVWSPTRTLFWLAGRVSCQA